MAEHFKVVFEGQLQAGVDLQTARLNLAQLFKSDVSSVDRLFTGKLMTLKRGLTHDDAQRYLQALREAGVEARLESEQPVAWTLEEVETHVSPQPAFQPSASPYAPPRAAVAQDWPEAGALKVFTVQGRIGRLRYLAWSFTLTSVALLLGAICFAIFFESLIAGALLGTVVFVAFVVISTQMGAQRLHDANLSGWLLLLSLIPVVGSFFPILLTLVPGSAGPNQYGPPPPPNTRSVKVLATLWVLALVLVIVGAIMGGVQKFKEEMELGTLEYEQMLPNDDDADEATSPDVIADPVDPIDPANATDDDK